MSVIDLIWCSRIPDIRGRLKILLLIYSIFKKIIFHLFPLKSSESHRGFFHTYRDCISVFLIIYFPVGFHYHHGFCLRFSKSQYYLFQNLLNELPRNHYFYSGKKPSLQTTYNFAHNQKNVKISLPSHKHLLKTNCSVNLN